MIARPDPEDSPAMGGSYHGKCMIARPDPEDSPVIAWTLMKKKEMFDCKHMN
jgi:hypothetical protein